MVCAGLCVVAVLLLCEGAVHGGQGLDESCAVSAVSDRTSADCAAAGCCDSGNGPSECGPDWVVTADALFLYRRGPAAAELMFNQGDLTQNLNAAEFDFGIDAGLDVSAVRSFGDGNGIEVRYFGLDP